jgi:glutamine synthetase
MGGAIRGSPNEDNLSTISEAARRARNIDFLPQTLQEAVTAFAAGSPMEATLGKELCDEFVEHKMAQWDSFHPTVRQGEIERYNHLL